MSQVTIRFEGPEEWENQFEAVNSLLDKHTGTSDYPATKSLPPIIFGAQLTGEAIAELQSLPGVIVEIQEE
ncbi:uncharacterized protein TRUGW13939_09591 [Talaromyces rugulosus]|uniref:Inhibitor I9 domain-containing protein n=1 Tax=Talaromyces rugulosus TaxID=121627 RepID=A0A7H8R7S1_TALRU|nr:uncharacterized protein TRUGW13939_09591 [Talaromyces rugulosus]QKX62430.1 hypothetical protein TRUGW13939_09591 [Talaromyces rugulosus]